MIRFKGGVAGAAPLQIQLGSSSTVPATVVGFSAAGDTTTGSASRPTLSRPSTPGKGTGASEKFSPTSRAASSTIITSFSSAPSTPTNSLVYNLPLRTRWACGNDRGFIVGVSGYCLLYAAASGGHTWTGEIIWEEH